jgi:two-component system, response regulator YesN
MGQESILIVDDEISTRRGIYATLEQHFKGAYELLLAEHGQEALSILQEKKIHLLLTDIRMPGMNGIELIEEMEARGIKSTVIFLTGYAEFEYAQKGIQMGVHNYLLKPIDRVKLVQAVEDGLEASKKRFMADVSMHMLDEKIDQLGGQWQSPSDNNKTIEKALKFIEANLSEKVGVREVAQHVHLSPSYFSVLFKDVKGMTFSEYVTRVRHRKAKEMLLTTDNDIAVIADEVGYQSASYFIRVFKEFEDMTPKQYRNLLKQ